MALQETQQFSEVLKRSVRPLICVPKGAGSDGYAAAIGLARILAKLDKTADIVAADGPTPQALHFLKGHEKVKENLEKLRKFVIELDATKAQVEELSYELKDGKLLIHLSPKAGFWDGTDVKTSAGAYRYDLIICIGAADLESCDHLYRDHPDFFYRTPIINIDHSVANEHFGHLNAVHLTATSCGEVCHDLFDAMDPNLIDEETATAFLAGMISKTKSFKHRSVTPKTLATASKLVARGAKRELIVENLYRTRSVHTLRLWGRALARLKSDPETKLVWTLLTKQDVVHAGADLADLPDVVDELIATSPEATVVVLLHETDQGGIRGIIRTERPHHALTLAKGLPEAGGNNEEAHVYLKDIDIVTAEKRVISSIRDALRLTRTN